MLVFLYDGVPPLDAEVAHVQVEEPEVSTASGPPGPPTRADAGKTFYSLPPYMENRCAECHNLDTGRLVKTVRQGLCRTCHPDKPPKKEFVHGPVAVNGCLACHHFHKSLHPKVLIADAQTLCLHCHEMDELRSGEHHATIEEERCIDCHDPHGGDDRFYLLPKAVAAGSSGNALIVEQER